MAQSKAQQKATAKYKKENYDRIEILVPKGKRDIIDDYVKNLGMTRNEYINKLINDDMDKD